MRRYTKAQLLERARFDGETSDAMYRSFSGTDVAEADYWRLRRLFWVDLWNERDAVAARTEFLERWRAYAASNNAKVDAAPKTKRGPMSGHSVIAYRWVSPDKAQNDVDVLQASGLPKR